MSECKKKHRSDQEKKALISRINRISGQLGGIKNMLESDLYCIDILTQISAAKAALTSLSKELLKEHINTCVVKGIKENDQKILSELCDTMDKFIK